MTTEGTVTGLAMPYDMQTLENLEHPNVLVVAVDNNKTRELAHLWGFHNSVPVAFVMMSRDGLRAQIVCQRPDGPCLKCLLPNFDSGVNAPCAAAAIGTCMMAAAHAVMAVADVLMKSENTPSWRETSLDGSTERVANPLRRVSCSCNELKLLA